MSLGPTLVGGVVGAAVGMGLHLLVEVVTGFEAPWFAIIIGLMTGLGVHQANKSLAGNVSYLRGAVTAAIALAAIVGSTPLISKVVSRRDVGAVGQAASADGARSVVDDAAAGDASAAGAAVDLAEQQRDAPAILTGDGKAPRVPGQFNVLQFIYMAVGTFIAYEFGRGAEKRVAAEPAPPVEEPLPATDPSN
ncbi:MAG TPA: hypothetical protein PJ982_01180 [Lacipirellulaceae bacterium]|nr:hypothetical protein [Lacipirellulaceae bacterium]